MKKMLSLILALVLMLSLAVPAFAAAGSDTANSTNNQKTITVTGTYTAGGTAENKISVDIVWTDMTFTYNAVSNREWNPSTHTYSTTTSGGSWAENDHKITVTNHSNVAVNASFAFEQDNAVTTVLTGSFSGQSSVGKRDITGGSVMLNAGVENEYGAADKVEAKLTLNGSLPEGWNDGAAIGSVTVSIAPATN